MRHLARLAGRSDIIQVESCPFHSPNLPKKHDLLGWFKSDPMLRDYVIHLKHFLADKHVFVVSAAPSQMSLSLETVPHSSWLSWQASMIGLDLQHTTFHPIVRKNDKVTAALLTHTHQETTKSMFLMMGNNNLPSMQGIQTIAECLRD